jgi:hypothetical protein
MQGETNLSVLLKTLTPEHNEGDYVFCTLPAEQRIDVSKIVGWFKEKEGATCILDKKVADELNLPYQFVAAWITLTAHSSLNAIGLTAAFSTALAEARISCNVIAGYYHDHIFVAKHDADKAMEVLRKLSVSF